MMRLFRQSVFIAVLAASALTVPALHATTEVVSDPDTVHLMINTYPTPIWHGEILDETVATLQKALAPKKLVVDHADLAELTRAIQTKRSDLAIVTAGQYRILSRDGLRDIAAINIKGFPDLNHCDGGAIVVRADRDDIQTIADLKGKRLSANSPNGYAGFYVQMGEIAARGFDPEEFFSSVRFTGEAHRMSEAAFDVVSGRSDAAFLALCLLETLEENGTLPKGLLKVVSEYKDARPLPCRRSTALYPSWVFATTAAASPELSRDAAAAILNQPMTPHGFQWGIATDFSRVDSLFRTLKSGPYSYLREWSFERVWSGYRNEVILAVLLLVGFFLHYARVTVLIRRKTKELSVAMEEKLKLQEKEKEASARLEKLQRAAAVAQMSSMLAHEIGQPLNAISCFAKGLLQRFENLKDDKTPSPLTVQIVERILKQSERARTIVNDVRSYAKAPQSREESVDLREIAMTAVANFQASHPKASSIDVRIPQALPIKGSTLELELLIVNLIKNASEALIHTAEPKIEVVGEIDGADVFLSVVDNGPAVSDELFATMTEPLTTTKVNGTGLGLAIVRSIAEAHSGKLVLERLKPTGLKVTVSIPLCTDTSCSQTTQQPH